MSRFTFTDFIFSWLANFKVDFRQTCSRCGTDPKILACDGTKIGMFFRHSNITPVETPTCETQYKAAHTRCCRQFFSYSSKDTAKVKSQRRLAKQDLSYFVAKNSNKLTEWLKEQGKKSVFDKERIEEDRKGNILSQVPPDCQALFSRFVNSEYPPSMMKSLCPIFAVLACDSPMTSLFHFRLLPLLSSVLDDCNAFEQLRNHMPEVFNVLQTAKGTGHLCDVVNCFHQIVKMIKEVHSRDRVVGHSEIVEVYNPEVTGKAYYFSSHGGRIRHLPKYILDKPSKIEEESSSCRKVFTDSSKSGTTFLFLWFDPLHGHCYGFHVINTSEGRKDPFASLYTFMEQCPEAVFYDFSCQLEEYCLNREPMFWRNCHFYHDIFHGFSHKCSFVYNSRRVPALARGINSEICEQFNSYIQKIKFSARSMNQTHFMFYMQFFIHRWNEMKARELAREEKMVDLLLQ